MRLLKTSLLVVLSFAVMSVQAANWNKSKVADIKITSDREPVQIVDIEGAQGQLCSVPSTFQRAFQFRGFKYPDQDFPAWTPNRDDEAMQMVWSAQALMVQSLDPQQRDEDQIKQWISKFVAALEKGNYSKISYTQPKAEYVFEGGKGSPDPTYGINIGLLNVAMLVSVIDGLDLWEAGQREVVVEWGNKAYPLGLRNSRNMSLKNQWIDNRTLGAVAHVAWGLVSGSKEILDSGIKLYESGIGIIKADGEFNYILKIAQRAWRVDQAFREDDKSVGLLVLAAHFAKQAGIDLYSKTNKKGQTIHDAVSWILRAHFTPEQTNQKRKLLKQKRIGSGLAPRHWAWTVVYVKDFGDTPVGKQLLEKSDQYFPRGGYWHHESMGPISCLFDRRDLGEDRYLKKYESQKDLGKAPEKILDFSVSTTEICAKAMVEWNSEPGQWAEVAESRGLSAESCKLFLK